ncbi:GTP-binding protein [Ornithinimicrobium sp. CNJ-824]|uniref:GTP-binding protein n=1 Tax=Ornithinimicrobium sp. CNJ-824 TaxID=1904966 RepID=UPI001EDBBB9C|nr:GTP-binding protein [Ornithinimicrobium sp. CNJ-824]
MNRTGASSFTPPASPAHLRNVVLVGPQGTGKSALLEQLTTGQLGHVKEAEEASTDLGVASTVHQATGTVVTVVDTPGRPDFVGDVRAGLRAADAVVFVVAAGSGIDEATRMLWRECEAPGSPASWPSPSWSWPGPTTTRSSRSAAACWATRSRWRCPCWRARS